MITLSSLWTFIELALIVTSSILWIRLLFFPDSKHYFALTSGITVVLCAIALYNVFAPGYVPASAHIVVAVIAFVAFARAFLWMLFGRQRVI